MTTSSDEASERLEIAEDTNYLFQTRAFRPVSCIVPPKPGDGKYGLSFRDWYTHRRFRPLKRLEPEHCRIFCWKDCIIYGNSEERCVIFATELLDEVWNEWFPHRAMDKDIYDDSFFARNLCFEPPAETIREIFEFHETFYKVVAELVKDIPEEKPPNYFSRLAPEPDFKSDYRLRDTFPEVFIVLRGDRREKGVLLCWVDKDLSRKYSFEVGASGVEEYDDSYGEIPEGAYAVRCPLKEAMRIVISTDPEREGPRRDYVSKQLRSIFYKEFVDSDEDDRAG